MAMSAGALRRWLIDHDALPEAPLIAMVPVSVRAHGELADDPMVARPIGVFRRPDELASALVGFGGR